jgi:hypothetical protein
MVALACGWCRRSCDLRGAASVLFHAPSGDAGTVCSQACAQSIRGQYPDLVPMLDVAVHFERANGSLAAALGPLAKASGQSAAGLGVDVLNAALFLGGVPLRVSDSAAGQRNTVVLAEAGLAARPLQQALLHLLALQALGVKLGTTISEIAGCDVDRLSFDVDVAGDQCTAMLRRVRAAQEILRAAALARRAP